MHLDYKAQLMKPEDIRSRLRGLRLNYKKPKRFSKI